MHSTGLRNLNKVLAKGSCDLGEQRGTAVVPLGAVWGGTMEGGQESHTDMPKQLLQLPSCRNQTLLGPGHGYPSPNVAAVLLLLVTPMNTHCPA